MSRSWRRWASVAIGALLLLATGWLGWSQGLAQVHVQLADAALRVEAGGVGAPLAVVADTTFEVENGNFLGAVLQSIDYVVLINGKEVGSGKGPGSAGDRTIPSHGRCRIATSTRLAGFVLAAAGLAGILTGKVDLEVRGVVRMQILGFDVTRDFRVGAPAIIGGSTAADILKMPATFGGSTERNSP